MMSLPIHALRSAFVLADRHETLIAPTGTPWTESGSIRTATGARLGRLTTAESRFERGLAKLAEVDGSVGEQVVAPLGDLGRYIVEFAFGDIYSRDGLSLRDREIATVALLAGQGGRDPQLRVHLGAALNVGRTPKELEEIVIHTVPYAGCPTAINALVVLREVLAQERQPRAAGEVA